MRIRNFNARRCARRAGGLHLGLRLHFPISIWDGKCSDNLDGTDTTYQSITIGIGLIAWEWSINLDYHIKRIAA
jgi:hypothetical protein